MPGLEGAHPKIYQIEKGLRKIPNDNNEPRKLHLLSHFEVVAKTSFLIQTLDLPARTKARDFRYEAV